jgi:hypothetical protein
VARAGGGGGKCNGRPEYSGGEGVEGSGEL